MLCVDCRRLTAMYKRDRCNLCAAGKPPAPPKGTYNPEDHVGKRARLRQAIDAAVQGAAIVAGGRHDRS